VRYVPRLSLVLLAAFAGCVAAPRHDEVADALAELVACPDLKGGRVGVMVYDPVTGNVLAESMADRGFAPASNNKLLTTAIAMESLGLDHRFVTRFATDANLNTDINRGRLAGNLLVIGGGDPTFADATFNPPSSEDFQWTHVMDGLRKLGIERIGGKVRGISSWGEEDNRGHGWQWDYLADDYAAPFGGLCAAGNVLKVRIKPMHAHAAMETVPTLLNPKEWVDSQVTLDAVGKDSELHVTRRLGQHRIEVRGVLRPAGEAAEFRVAVSDPITFAEAVITSKLQATGVMFEGMDIGASPPTTQGSTEIMSLKSRPLSHIAKPLLTNSNNLYAEQLFRGAAFVNRASASNSAARAHAGETLRALDVDTQGLVMADGSGLSRRNLVQPRQLVQLLRTIRRRSYAKQFLECLPIAGVTGTLKNRFAEGPAHQRVRAKTGFISRVVCLSGYILRDDQEPLIFSVMLNDFTCETTKAKAACDHFIQRLAAAH